MNGYWCIFALAALYALVAIIRMALAHRKAQQAARRAHELAMAKAGGEAK